MGGVVSSSEKPELVASLAENTGVEAKHPSITFDASDGSFHFGADAGASADSWAKLADACEGKTSAADLDWAPVTGETEIAVRGPIVVFTVAEKTGICGGFIRVELPVSQCVKGFREAERLTSEYCALNSVQ